MPGYRRAMDLFAVAFLELQLGTAGTGIIASDMTQRILNWRCRLVMVMVVLMATIRTVNVFLIRVVMVIMVVIAIWTMYVRMHCLDSRRNRVFSYCRASTARSVYICTLGKQAWIRTIDAV